VLGVRKVEIPYQWFEIRRHIMPCRISVNQCSGSALKINADPHSDPGYTGTLKNNIIFKDNLNVKYITGMQIKSH
jgi:hypothetical protein